MIDKSTTVVAIAGLVNPMWVPSLAETSDILSLLLQFAGLIWLIVQIVGYINKKG
jgi:hypothetical protein